VRKQQRTRTGRSNTGSLGLLLVCAAVMIAMMLGCIALDVAHVISVVTELQNATDAAALAGARDIDIDDELAEERSLRAAALNLADGRPVSNDVLDRSVWVRVKRTDRLSPGFVEVRATATVYHILARILGRPSDTVSTTAIAGPSGTISYVKANRAFPIVVSIDAIPRNDGSNDKVLNRQRLTDTLTLYIDSQDTKNAAFTSFAEQPYKYDYLRTIIDRALGLPASGPGSIPPVKIGDKLHLSDGIVGQRHLAGNAQYAWLLSKPVVILPVIVGYPQQLNEAVVVGFVGARILSAEMNYERGVVETLKIRLIKNVPQVISGNIPVTGSVTNDLALSLLSPGALKLLPAVGAMTGFDEAVSTSPIVKHDMNAGLSDRVRVPAPAAGRFSTITTDSPLSGTTAVSSARDRPRMSDYAKTVKPKRIFSKLTAGNSKLSDTLFGGGNNANISPDFDVWAGAHLVGSRGDPKACANANRGQSTVITWPIVVALLFCACLGMALRTSRDSRGGRADRLRFTPVRSVPKAFTKSMYPILREKLQTMQARRQRAELAREARKFGLASGLGAARGHVSYSRFGQIRSKLHWQRSTRGRRIPGSAAVLDLQLSRWESGINIIHEPL